MRITSAGKVKNYVAFASTTLAASPSASLLLVGSGATITKATSVVEILKRTCSVAFVQTTTLSRAADQTPQIELLLTRSDGDDNNHEL
jgi:hypothetical protein